MKDRILLMAIFVLSLFYIGFAQAGTNTNLPQTVSASTANNFSAEQTFTGGVVIPSCSTPGEVLTSQDGSGTMDCDPASGGISENDPNVFTTLQTFQTNIDVQNTIITNGFQMPTGAVNGYVLTTDGDGTASWQAASGGSGGISSVSIGSSLDCGISISGSTMTIGELGSNHCIVGAKSSVSGEATTLTFGAAATLTFGSSSDTDGNTFGMGLIDDWDQSAPMLLGVIHNSSDEFAFITSRVPIRSSGTVGQLCQKGDTDCDGAYDAMLITSGETLANWVGEPITWLGWYEHTVVASGVIHTFTVGEGGFHLEDLASKVWDYPDGVMGNLTGRYGLNDGAGTVALFVTNDWTYKMDPIKGTVRNHIYLDGDGGADGSAGTTPLLRLCGPYHNVDDNDIYYPYGRGVFDGGGATRTIIPVSIPHTPCTKTDGNVGANLDGTGNHSWGDFINGNKTIQLQYEWNIVD